ncbi:hypothetical protein [Parasediminibacterium sp. JCM 36343]|uniref:hypothetical protein n=1 Tax=Parasediminibacterium sp. JCM 36343 TaxID=3374279 RepID=UPI00397C460E
MTVSKAIRALDNLKSKIPTDEESETLWLTQTSSFIKLFFGQESKEYKFINNFSFKDSVFRPSEFWKESWKGYDPNPQPKTDYKKTATLYLDDCIETLKIKGLYCNPEQSILKFLFSSKNWYLTSSFIAIIYTAGIMTAKLTITEKSEKQLASSSFIAKSDTIPNKKSNIELKATDTNSINK